MSSQSHHNDRNCPLLLCLKGAQGSGKDKQAELLEATFLGRSCKPIVLSMSDILEKTEDEEVRAIMSRGDPVRCERLKPLFDERMTRALAEGHDVLIANGYPRYTTRQVDDFAELARKHGCRTIVVHIRAALELCRNRIVRRAREMEEVGKTPRADDLDPVAVEKRLGHYFRTQPFVSRRLLHFHAFPHVTVTASDNLTKEELHAKIVQQLWPHEAKPVLSTGFRPLVAA